MLIKLGLLSKSFLVNKHTTTPQYTCGRYSRKWNGWLIVLYDGFKDVLGIPMTFASLLSASILIVAEDEIKLKLSSRFEITESANTTLFICGKAR